MDNKVKKNLNFIFFLLINLCLSFILFYLNKGYLYVILFIALFQIRDTIFVLTIIIHYLITCGENKKIWF